MAVIKGVIQNPSNISFSDGDEVNLTAGKRAALLVSQQTAELYEVTYRGHMFHSATTPLGLAIPIYTSVTPTVCLWNPIGSGVNLILHRYSFSYASGTAAYGAVGLMKETNAGSGIATGAVFSAFNEDTPVNGIIGGGTTSAAKVSISGTNTLTTLGDTTRWIMDVGSINLEAATGTAHGVNTAAVHTHATIIIPPGSAVWPAATKASVALYAQTISWTEIPA
jgi:hypothetical protein